MDSLPTGISARERAAALVIVLAFVVLFTVLVVAYLSRTTGDRQVAHSSFNQSKADQLAASATDLIIGALQQEIANGSSPTPSPTCNPTPNPCSASPSPTGTPSATPTAAPSCTPTASPFVYYPTPAANMVPVQWPTASPARSPIPNLARVSKRGDELGGANPVPAPGIP